MMEKMTGLGLEDKFTVIICCYNAVYKSQCTCYKMEENKTQTTCLDG